MMIYTSHKTGNWFDGNTLYKTRSNFLTVSKHNYMTELSLANRLMQLTVNQIRIL